jgi:hypothetical protein
MPSERALEVPISADGLRLIRHDALRSAAADALARGEDVRLVAGPEHDGERVETVHFPASRRGAQSSGTAVVWGEWTGERLLTDRGGHMLGPDGACFCRDCETAARMRMVSAPRPAP